MRPFRAHGLAVMAMLLLLLGTAAPALARMTCVMGGPSILSLGQAKECTPVDHEHPETTVSATCCEVLQTQPQRTDFVPAASVLMPVLGAVVMPAVVVPSQIRGPEVPRERLLSRPPPLACERRLANLGHFRI